MMNELRVKYKEILDSLPISVYRVDTEGRLTYLNEVMRRQLGVPMEAALGKTAFDFHPEELAKKYQKDDAHVLSTQTELVFVEEHWRESEKKLAHVEVIKQPLLNEKNECIGIQGIYADVSGIREKLIDAERRTLTDPLTELPNRKAIELQLEKHYAKTKRQGYFFSLVFVDLNGFKQINDIHGHLAGDQVLVKFANRLLRVTRGNDEVGRYAGDEFIIILDDIHSREEFEKWYQRAEYELCKPMALDNQKTISVKVSMGVCLCPQSSLSSTKALLNEADKMMYQAKNDPQHSFYISGY